MEEVMQLHLVKSVALASAVFALPALVKDRGSDPCDNVSDALRRSDEAGARADYWLALATCRNGPGGDANACEQDAKAELSDALALAKARYDARIAACASLGGGRYDPRLSPGDFSLDITNPLSPMTPGTTFVYEGDSADGFVHNEVTTLSTTATIDGFTVRTIEDTVTLDGVLSEDATDYFAQHSNGSVWYFGEVSRTYVDGFLDDLEGSWRTGREGAMPGIIMLATPKVGDFYRQEYQPGVAEDVARVVALDETVTIALGTFDHCVKIEETSPLEPDALEWKFYAPGVGLVLDLDLETGDRLELVEIK
jgi:hypothetical protein